MDGSTQRCRSVKAELSGCEIDPDVFPASSQTQGLCNVGIYVTHSIVFHLIDEEEQIPEVPSLPPSLPVAGLSCLPV